MRMKDGWGGMKSGENFPSQKNRILGLPKILNLLSWHEFVQWAAFSFRNFQEAFPNSVSVIINAHCSDWGGVRD